MTAPESPKTVERHDRWSLWLPGAGVLAVLLYWCCIISDWFLLSVPTGLAAFFIAWTVLIIMFACLVMCRFRAALAALVAVAIMAGGVALRGSIVNLARYVDFAVHRAGYERAVEALRAKNSGFVPLRVILKDVDVSIFIVNIFDYVVYDESDAIGRNPPAVSGDWLCADPTGGSALLTYAVGNIVVRRLGGHFYFVEQTL